MKTQSVIIAFLVLAIGLSCRLFYRDKYMFDRNNLQEAVAAFKSKNVGRGALVEMEISRNKIYFNTGVKNFVFSKGFLSEDRFKSPSASKDFRPDEIDFSNLDKAMAAAVELAKKNPYMDKTEVSRIIISKQMVNRDDNLVSNIDKWREAIRWEIYVADSDNESQYTTNQQGEIVDVAATNVKPRLKFFDTNQMNKSLAEIKPLFGGKLSVAGFTIQTEDFSFTALDPKNADEMNVYFYNSHEFLQAYKSPFQKTLEDKKREEEMRRGGTTEEIIQMRRPQFIFFDIEEIDFSLIPQVMQKTLATAKASNPKVSSFNIRKRQDQFTKVITLEWEVHTYGDRSEKETIIFDGKGNLKEGK